MTDIEALRYIKAKMGHGSDWVVLQSDGSIGFTIQYTQVTALKAAGLVRTKYTINYRITTLYLTAKGREALR